MRYHGSVYKTAMMARDVKIMQQKHQLFLGLLLATGLSFFNMPIANAENPQNAVDLSSSIESPQNNASPNNGITVVSPQRDMNTRNAITIVNSNDEVNTSASNDIVNQPHETRSNFNNTSIACSPDGSGSKSSSTMSPICSNHSNNDIKVSGIELNVYGGLVDLTTKFGSETINNPPFSAQTNTLVGSTDGAGFEPGFGVAYDFYLAPYNQVAGIGYVLKDVSLGVDAYYLRGIRKGSVYYSGDFPSNNYNATLSSWQVMLDTQWDFHPLWKLIPFAQAGIGDAINSLSYNEVSTRNSIPGQFVINLPRGVHNNLAYDVGGGIKLPTSEHTQLSLRYLYSDLGDVSATSSQLASPLTVNMHSSSLLLGFTYLFG